MICNMGDYLYAICDAYKAAKTPCCSPELLPKIERGRRRIISGIAEDYFAELMCNTLNDDSLHFFVDQPIKNGKHRVYPDIVIARENGVGHYIILYMVDLKMDVGYYRNAAKSAEKSYIDKAEELEHNLNSLRASKIITTSGWREDLNAIASISFEIAETAHYDMVVISAENAGGQKDKKELLKLSSSSDFNIWALSAGVHPNNVREIKDIILLDDWKILLERVRASCCK